jgi:iron complex transport system substrate-binding protein
MSCFIVKTAFLRASLGFMALGLLAFADSGSARWVSTSPQVTELLFQLGQSQHLVGTSDQTFYPEAAKQLPKVGLLFNPNLEAIVAQSPTGILWDESSYRPDLEAKLVRLGLKSVLLNLSSVENLFASIEKINEVLGNRIDTNELLQSEIIWKKAGLKSTSFSFIALAWAEPPILFGKDTFLVNLLKELGGTSILPVHWSNSYPKVSTEWLISQNPDYLFFLKHDDASSLFFQNQCRKWWPKTSEKCVGIPAEKFARASLTPLLHLAGLKSEIERRK